jgi:hypothetical protein
MSTQTPKTYTTVNETGCCAVPNIDGWQRTVIDFENVRFIRLHTRSMMFVPLNMDQIMTKLQQIAEAAEATMPPEEAMVLSRDLSPWRAEQLYAVSKPVPGADNVVLDGKFASLVFEGDYSKAKDWRDEMVKYSMELGHKADEIYFFYTTCPKCAEHYGKNYVVGLAKLE